MKKLLVCLALALAAVPLYADSNALPGGPMPGQVNVIAGKYSTTGKNVPLAVDANGNVLVNSTGATASTLVKSTALEASHVLKASTGSISALIVTDTASEYILIINSATVPADGAVVLLMPPIKVTANVTTMITFPVPWPASIGISVCNSSTGTLTKTLGGSTCIYGALVN